MIKERLAALRQEMAKRNIAIYMVPTSDFHESEYVGDFFKAREFITGFTGSAGTAIITQTEAGLWTDGRYFVQAEQQLAGSGINLYKKGEEDVPEETEYIKETLREGDILGFDGRVVNGKLGAKLETIAREKKGSLYRTEDLVGLIWENRPSMSASKVWVLSEEYAGESAVSKLDKIRGKMKDKTADIHLISSLYDIAWILNIRGDDITYVPVVLSYLVITRENCILFVQPEALTDEVRNYLCSIGVEIRDYDGIWDYVASISSQSVWVDSSIVNDRICCSFKDSIKVIDDEDASVSMKAIKNEIQIEHIRSAHLKDAVAMCKFMYWLKTNIGKIPMTEISVSDYLYELRAKQEGFLSLSFDTISGYAEHGAIVHYSANEESDKELKPEGLLLVDSGGHYLDGTTDVTRTFALGTLSKKMKQDFTKVCRANINLASAKFRYGCTGQNLDILAREPLWESQQDYNHGTGHGVGYILNVHEGPNAFRWRMPKKEESACVLEAGMVTTDEPGLYLTGEYGIRTESELLCCKGDKNEFGQFMYFENLTYVPIDLDAILPEEMTERERKRLNEYHRMVYEKVAPFLDREEAEWLHKYTREI